jgi:hypothetical protein
MHRSTSALARPLSRRLPEPQPQPRLQPRPPYPPAQRRHGPSLLALPLLRAPRGRTVAGLKLPQTTLTRARLLSWRDEVPRSCPEHRARTAVCQKFNHTHWSNGEPYVSVKGDFKHVNEPALKTLPPGMVIDGDGDLSCCPDLEKIEDLCLRGNLSLDGCHALRMVRHIVVRKSFSCTGAPELRSLLHVTVGGDALLGSCPKLCLLERLRIGKRGDFRKCDALASAGDIIAKTLFFNGCRDLAHLYAPLECTDSLDLSECKNLETIEDGVEIGKHLVVDGCEKLFLGEI